MDSKISTSSVSSTLTNVVLWMFVPAAITNFLLRQFYSFKYAKNSPSIPKPNSLKHKRNHKICYTLVIGVYFLYCLGQSIYSLEESYYSKLGVRRGSSRSEIKKKTRLLIITHHPDKSAEGNTEKYHELKKMAEVLENSNLCNIYEKFGDSGVTSVQQSSSKKNFTNDQEIRKNYIFATIFEWAPFFAGSAAVLLLLSITQKSDSMKYWRFICLLVLASYESYLYFVDFTTLDTIYLSSNVSFLSPMSWISGLISYVPFYQRIHILRQLFIYSGLAMNQLGPIWFKATPDLITDKKALLKEIEDIQNGFVSEIYQETKYFFDSAFVPFEDNAEMMSLLKRQMGQVVVDLKFIESMNSETLENTKRNR
jgi:hypothetical protein